MKRRASSRALALCVVLLLVNVLAFALPAEVAARDPSNPRDFYGIVGYDPWYEYNTDPERHPNDVNRTFLENMVKGMAEMGAGWVRIEFHAEYDQATGPGWIDYSKHDWYIKELAPKYGIKVLAVLGSGVLADLDKTYQFKHINDPAGADGTNLYSRAYVQRVKEIADHYGDSIAAYEVLNEPNANQLLHWETDGRVKAVDPEIYGQILSDIYRTVKPAHPNVEFVAGAMLLDNQQGVNEHFDWLEEVYAAPAIRNHVREFGRHPFDGMSIHPYYLSPANVLSHMQELRELQAAAGDTTGIWITEIGLPAEPPSWSDYGIMDPTSSEQEQSEFLRDIYITLRDQAPYVERIFWFKYEDFGGGGTWANWGLVRFRESSFRFGPEAVPWPRKDAYHVFQSLARPELLPTAPVSAPGDVGDRVRYFPETGHTLRDPFLHYWEEHGGLAMFGFPKTEVFYVAGRAVQYFERARFEYWPENKGTVWEVQLGLLGRYETRDRSFAPQPAPGRTESGRAYFPQTQQYLVYGFKEYWENNGGLSLFGYPISGEFQEVSPVDGKTYTVQYFERARFEWHPEHQGTPFEVQLGLLGNQVLSAPGWYR